MSNPPFSLTGAGSQPAEEDGSVLEYMQMPDGMMTFSQPNTPEPEDVENLVGAKAVLESVLQSLRTYRRGDEARRIDLSHLDPNNLRFVDQLLGSGEVSIVAGNDAQIQEAVMAGIWRVRHAGPDGRIAADAVEVGHVPSGLWTAAFGSAPHFVAINDSVPPAEAQSAGALLSEINDNLAHPPADGGAYTINLSLLPHTEEDLAHLANSLGGGSVVILSRGYGNCRISSTGTRNVWWVQYYNSQDALILNTIEISGVPEVACAAMEDIADSAERLDEILEIYR
ncbi:hydrogenase expression/formation C-terminal domain-containing protein [Dongia sp.]|uniref:hydrogenase expression/formation protein n=1 Tax=Dongia sp. TaxID=1977262 RepID=UPI0035B12769